ncbi:MAG: SAM-dependent methyltransferase, partial [Chloroflexi bacterium]|nr:SAM-dependent methyltransferase [Chloroflexota bacterium]
TSEVWSLLERDPDRYIYAAVRHGVHGVSKTEFLKNSEVWDGLPAEIAVGLDDPQRREGWNKPAPEEFALPTEIWREVVARRRRYQQVKEKLSRGEVTSINDLITLNLDIRQFAQDVIQDSDADLLLAFWKAISQIKVLDPTVGSGAFLFAALNVLEPLYEACVERMSALVEELDRSGEKHSPKKYEPFRKVLEQVRQRPDEDYFIFKSIIINNLYGVDIMEEAVEICKLRLFLKLASQVEPDASKENLGIEPLPDIDFNIRAGNTLVGFATREDVKRSVQFGTVGGVQSEKLFAMPEEDAQLKRIEEKAEDVDRLYKLFRQQQTEYGGEVRPEDKRELQKRLGELEKELNILLARQYAIHNAKGEAYQKWLASHTPFHWFVEFFGIMNEGGFDVIVGNPPYVEYGKVRNDYTIQGLKTETSGNLYAFVIERVMNLVNSNKRIGVIIPLSFVSTDGFSTLRDVFSTCSLWVSNFAIRPAKLFEGVEHRLTIAISSSYQKEPKKVFSTRYRKWAQDERPSLLAQTKYGLVSELVSARGIPKLGSDIEINIWKKFISLSKPFQSITSPRSNHPIYYTRKFGHFVLFTDFIPLIEFENGKTMEPTELKSEFVSDKEKMFAYIAHFNSTLSYWHLVTVADCRNLNKRDVLSHPIPLLDNREISELAALGKQLMKDFRKNASHTKMVYPNQPARIIEVIHPGESREIIDEIDRALARHYGLSDEELDFIINYDVKYRMGAEAGQTSEFLENSEV